MDDSRCQAKGGAQCRTQQETRCVVIFINHTFYGMTLTAYVARSPSLKSRKLQ